MLQYFVSGKGDYCAFWIFARNHRAIADDRISADICPFQHCRLGGAPHVIADLDIFHRLPHPAIDGEFVSVVVEKRYSPAKQTVVAYDDRTATIQNESVIEMHVFPGFHRSVYRHVEIVGQKEFVSHGQRAPLAEEKAGAFAGSSIGRTVPIAKRAHCGADGRRQYDTPAAQAPDAHLGANYHREPDRRREREKTEVRPDRFHQCL